MPIFKTMTEILDPWFDGINSHELPLKEDWLSKEDPKISNIDTWEQIYNQPGNIGVYAAWSPYVELYILVHTLFLNMTSGIEVFRNSESISARLHELGLDLPTNIVWI